MSRWDETRRVAGAGVLGALLLVGCEAHGVPLPGDLSLTGTAEFLLPDSFVADSGTQAGTFGWISGGVASNNAYVDEAVTNPSANPLSAALTEVGDGFSLASVSGNAPSFGEFAAVLDALIGITNTSATTDYLITFEVGLQSTVEAEGSNAFALTDYLVETDFGATSAFGHLLLSDTVQGDDFNGTLPGTFGALLTDTVTATFAVLVAAGTTNSVDVFFEGAGGSLAVNEAGTAMLDFGASLRILAVTPSTVPEPGTALLLGASLVAFAVRRRSRVAS